MSALATINPATLKPSNDKDGKAGDIRDKMLFDSEYYCMRTGATLRIYRTKGGSYGPQFQAILWINQVAGGVWISKKTSGCGYNKVNHVAHEALVNSGLIAADAMGGHAPDDVLAYALGGSRSDIHHAHG